VITVSYDTFFNHNYEILRGYIWKIVNNWEDSEELALDAFTNIFEKWDTFSGEEHIRRYLFICAKNLSFNHLDKRGAQKRGHTVELKPWMELDEVEIVEIEFYDIMLNSLHALPPERRKVFLMLLEGKSKADVAEELGISPHTVKNHRIQAIKSIQSYIKNKKL